MIILHDVDIHKRLKTLAHSQAWLLERMMTVDLVSGDLRWALMDLALHAVSDLSGLGRDWLVSNARRATGRVSRRVGACKGRPLLTQRWQQRPARLENSSNIPDMESAA